MPDAENVKCPVCHRFLMESGMKGGFAEVICQGCKARVRVDASGAKVVKPPRRGRHGVDAVWANPEGFA